MNSPGFTLDIRESASSIVLGSFEKISGLDLLSDTPQGNFRLVFENGTLRSADMYAWLNLSVLMAAPVERNLTIELRSPSALISSWTLKGAVPLSYELKTGTSPENQFRVSRLELSCLSCEQGYPL